MKIIEKTWFKILLLVVAIILIVLIAISFMNPGPKFDFSADGDTTKAEQLDEISEEEDEGEQVFYLSKEDVYGFSFTDAHGIYLTFEKRDDDWVCTDNESIDVDANRVDKLLNYLTDVRFIDTVETDSPEEYGFNDESKSYHVVDGSGNSTIIMLGNVDDKSGNIYFALNYDYSIIYVNSGKLIGASEYNIEDFETL